MGLGLLWHSQAGALTPGFVEDFDAGDGGFMSSLVESVIVFPSGGVDDGPYLDVSDSNATFLEVFSTSSNFAGDYPMDGVSDIAFHLSGDDAMLEIHASLGNAANLWQSTPGFTPPLGGAWTQYQVDVSDEMQWTQIVATGQSPTFASALAAHIEKGAKLAVFVPSRENRDAHVRVGEECARFWQVSGQPDDLGVILEKVLTFALGEISTGVDAAGVLEHSPASTLVSASRCPINCFSSRTCSVCSIAHLHGRRAC